MRIEAKKLAEEDESFAEYVKTVLFGTATEENFRILWSSYQAGVTSAQLIHVIKTHLLLTSLKDGDEN